MENVGIFAKLMDNTQESFEILYTNKLFAVSMSP